MLNNGFQSIINALKKNKLIRKLSSIPSLYEYKEKARKALNDYALRKSMRYEASRVENSIFVESFHGKNFSGDPKYLAIAMKKEHPFLKVYVSSINQLVDTEILSYGFTPVRLGSKLYLEAANYADYIIVNGNTLDKVNINEQKVIQTWHGFPLKKMVNDLNDESKKEEELKMFLPRMKKWDYLLTSSDVNTKLLSSAFNVTENSKLRILEYGAPRNEYIIANKTNDNEVGKIFWKYFNREYNADLKIILFCPTWRKGKRNSVSSLDLKRLIDGLPEDYHIIVKLHPLESHLRKNYSELDSRIHCFFNEVVDIQELYLLSSLLITDYSSTIFDYAHLKRSLLLIQDDEEEYSDAVGFYFDSEKITGIPKVKMSEDELCIEIINLIESKIVNHSIEISKYMEKDSEDTSKRIMRKIIKKYS
ncbi:CDP-glycerol glycerophosphotransferase family protein [Vagococcus salmoninarum]|uniref:CDP-glycerol glycerophosphotransferase family protein n=3 Tax=Vagococcus salmoninarum TaxID=2739 RepID=UPI003F9AFC91